MYNLEDYFSDTKEYLIYPCPVCESSQTFLIEETLRPYKQGSYGHPGRYQCRCCMCGEQQVVEGKKQRLPKKRKNY